MPTSRPRTILRCGVIAIALALAIISPSGAATQTRVDGVWQTNAKTAELAVLKRADFPQALVATTRFAPVEASRVQRVLGKQHQSGPLQIGIARDLATESDSPAVPDLHWLPAAGGGQVARMEVTSPEARALRVGIRVDAIADGVELRVFGSVEPGRIVGAITATQIRASLVDGRVYWTPHTDGETQTLEWYVPAGHATTGLRIRLTGVSHMLTAAEDGFVMPKAACSDGTGPNCAAPCEVDAVCDDNLGSGYQASVSSVALMEFMDNGSGFLCTGTLLDDTVNSRTPYVYSANHCIGDQASASTLNTFWFAQNTNCGGPIVPPPTLTELTNGSDLLYGDASSDVTLLRLRDTPPDGAFFAGWDASHLALNTGIAILHHPLGDGTKISQGTAAQYISSVTVQDDGSVIHDLIGVGFTSGIVEGGSSGSGLLTRSADGNYLVRGALSVKFLDLDCSVVGQPYGGANGAAFS
ncbi:MAG: trypsin-like peptidase domain-containing protein, partial [Rhodanobacteraceae bacterium]